MLIFRWLLFILLIASALCFVFFLGTGMPHYKYWGFLILKWAVIAGLAFFAVLGLSRFLMI
ncbi:hypothetical protein [Comamonas jiangduensis]|uniref:hypothetical protein n=1 Tax=Comamonas jiangduensis TaxID=1194168 RepID=UPI001581ED63|nr:hypothetical protein [Comamonas jiangduensis]